MKTDPKIDFGKIEKNSEVIGPDRGIYRAAAELSCTSTVRSLEKKDPINKPVRAIYRIL